MDNLEMTIKKTEENYAGFPDKVKPANRAKYDDFKIHLLDKAINTNDTDTCYSVLKQYVNYFYDKHFRVEYSSKPDSVVIPIDLSKINKLSANPTSHAVTGIWKDNKDTKIAIVQYGTNTFKALKVSSTNDTFPQGFVYFTLTDKGDIFSASLYNRKINIDIPAQKIGSLLKIWNMQLWVKEGTELTPLESEELESWKDDKNGLMFKKINNDFTYLKIPTFENNDEKISRIVTENDSIIKSTRFLIIDLRGNGGGSSGWTSLIPYIATAPIHQGGSYLRISKENSNRKMSDLDAFVNNPIPEGYKKYFPPETLKAYREAYRELSITKKQFLYMPSVSFPLDSILPIPEKVALVFDELAGSSTEFFINLSKQSDKVFTYGHNSVGMMDYVGMSIPTKLPFEGFMLYIPPEKSSWTDTRPIDRIGFSPHVKLKDQQEEWIERIMLDLPHRKLLK
ncbi:hypothetical protein HP439_12855 [Sphingobacterium shayense]|uniref:S41 family peptidase n=1 Tax=Sphingobacterium shayense TaxID=626343 RepID=UPI00155251C9|nr:S41 family peptidase [Sphingobacterium shayense]NQD71612.1 hypothetical protein [Sphingobacterium shayense]